MGSRDHVMDGSLADSALRDLIRVNAGVRSKSFDDDPGSLNSPLEQEPAA
jgi:hypothetical protein